MIEMTNHGVVANEEVKRKTENTWEATGNVQNGVTMLNLILPRCIMRM